MPSPKTSETLRVPTVSRVAGDTLIELVYDPEKRKTALAVSRFDGLWNIEQEVKIGTDEILTPYAASNNLIANGCVLLPSVPVHHSDKNELLSDIRRFLHAYVDLTPAFEQFAAHYILLSWVHDAFGELPYLRLRGDYGTGKTRALMVVGALCYKPFFASGASTVSPIFHMLDTFGGTLVLDEADLPYSDAKAELVKILNNGTVKGMPVLRTVQNRHKEFNPYAFKVFGPKLVATRERFQDRALESRFITEETGTRPLRPDIPIHLPPSWTDEALALRNRLLHFRLAEFFKITTDASALTAGADPRLNQTALSLLSLVDDPQERADMQAALMRQFANDQEDRRESAEGYVLAAAVAAFKQVKPGQSIGVRDIADRYNRDHCNDIGRSVSNKWVGYMLRVRLGIRTYKSNGNYVISDMERGKLETIAIRYGIATDAAGAV
jgi:hypothetical protein